MTLEQFPRVKSVWGRDAGLDLPALESDAQTDVLVVGAGIAGLTCAYLLAKEGRTVVVLEAGTVGSGETGRTSAHLSTALDDRYYHLAQLHGAKHVMAMADGHRTAIKKIEAICAMEHIDCGFRRVPGYLFMHPEDPGSTLKLEAPAALAAGLNIERLPHVPGLSGHHGPCLMFPQQAQFHPLRYLRGLALAVQRAGGRIYEHSRGEDIGADGAMCRGHRIRARHIVVATNTPVNERVSLHTKQAAYRTYLIAARMPAGSVAPALYWDTGTPDGPYHYVRTFDDDDASYLLVGGEDHKTGQGGEDSEDRWRALEAWARPRFPWMTDVTHHWSGQVMESVDGAAYLGRTPGGPDNVYIVSGDSGNGLTHGTLGAMLIGDLIGGRANKWEDVFRPSRVNVLAAKTYLRENLNVIKQARDYFTPGDYPGIEDLRAGDGAVIREGLKKVAVYREETGELRAFSAVCPHLGCVVRWNSAEKSFDCPCHGSRFGCHGEVLCGPANRDLAPVEEKGATHANLPVPTTARTGGPKEMGT